MAEAEMMPLKEKKAEKEKPSHPPFLEVKCKTSGKTHRFAEGSTAKFALKLINSKLESGAKSSLCIAAVKEGEEPVVFGPTAPLVDYGDGWKLETLIVAHGQDDAARPPSPSPKKHTSTTKKAVKKPEKEITTSWLVSYLGRILLAFAFMFALAGALSYFLVVLPDYLELLSKYWDEYGGEPIMSA
ncbi:hypothetical protein LUZ60_006653 [Juncus effusus]|nr:hypothetical protein LUZ60_006653 [Juncus effusus]